jgi:hypothetical protein
VRLGLLVAALVLVTGSAVAFRVMSARVDARIAERFHAEDVARHKRDLPVNEALFADSKEAPTFGGDHLLESQLCTQAQYDSPAMRHWIAELKEQPHYHSKLWEYSFILQAISERGLMTPGKKGIGFGVGQEPLPSVFAKHGVEILATDLDLATATKDGWANSEQYMSSLEVLNQRGIASDEEFHRLVKAANVDMTKIPDTLQGFDFTWSTCALGHLGNLEKGMQFIEDSLKTLKPGGIAVHTTELNLSSDTDTIESPRTSVYRRHDIEELVRRLTAEGHEVHVNFNIGNGPLDRYVDERPYTSDKHLRLRLGPYAATSLGIVIRKSTRTSDGTVDR